MSIAGGWRQQFLSPPRFYQRGVKLFQSRFQSHRRRNITTMQLSNAHQQLVVVELGSISYYVRDRVECLLPGAKTESTGSFIPATVIHLPSTSLSLEEVQNTIKQFREEDDVFQDAFTSGSYLIVKPQVSESSATETPPSDVTEYLTSRHLELIYLEQTEKVAQGPYFVVNGELHQAWRLYPDDLEAFTTAVIPDDSIARDQESPVSFRPFYKAELNAYKPSVAIPSRLYFEKSEAQPLAGLRLSIKDNMHLKGIKTTLGSRAYTELYEKQSKSAEYVDLLIKNGAVVVGKTKMSAYAGSEVPPKNCIDYFPPWNARGDGYQGPSGSSSGAAASIAGYPWLDISLCTDTTGSMRNPAACHGTWGHKPTWGLLSMENVVPSVPVFDTVSILARSAPLIQTLLSSSGSKDLTQKPTEIIYPTDWYPCEDANQQRMNEEFLTAVENYIGVKHTPLSLIELWSQTAPEEFRDQSLTGFLAGDNYNVAGAINQYDGYHSFDDFRREYFERFGKQPYVSPMHKQRWDEGAEVPEEERTKAMEKVDIFKSWFDQHVWKVNEEETRRIMIVPLGRPGANYRDGTPGTSASGQPYSPIFVTSMAGLPQAVVPVGQNPYDSVISGQKEFAPIVSSLIGPKGSDLSLLKVAEETLKMASWQSTVLTGRFMLHPDDNTRNAQSVDASKL